MIASIGTLSAVFVSAHDGGMSQARHFLQLVLALQRVTIATDCNTMEGCGRA
ncbi:MAG: hypothetical protein ABFD86_10565 [Bryobacteraceae bacterium]